MLTLLFDIDGTLIRSGGAGKLAMESALLEEFGVREILDVVPYSGRTDRGIARDLLSVHGLDPCDANQSRLNAAYLERLPAALRQNGGVVCPGVEPLLGALRDRQNVALGLLTGNTRQGARHKLEHFDLWHHFPAGGFGDDHAERDDVARMALREMERHGGRRPVADEVWVIGDTPLDVKCARAIGANALAVATGWHPRPELDATGAELVLDDLSDTAGLLRHWGLE